MQHDSAAPLRLAFIDPGLRKAPFFLELRHWLAPRVHCLYWSERPVVRSYMRSARVAMHPPRIGLSGALVEIGDEELRRAIGDKELTLRPRQSLARARQLLGRIAAFLDTECVDAILVWNGSNLRGALAVYLARQRGIRVLYAEHGYLPGTTQIDPQGVNFQASITAVANAGLAQLPPDPALDAELDADIARFRAGARMRDVDPLPPADLRRNLRARAASRIGFWLERRALPAFNRLCVPRESRPLPARYVLLPFQVRSDSQLMLHSPLYGNDLESLVRELDQALSAMDPSLTLVAKFHPYELPQVQRAWRHLARRYPRVHFIGNQPMCRLIEQAEAVVTVNSTAGFEALLHDKPVLAVGRNFYTIPGVVTCLARRQDLPAALQRLLKVPPDQAQRRAFLRFVKARLLVDGGYHDFSPRSLGAVASRVARLLEPAQRFAAASPALAPAAHSPAMRRNLSTPSAPITYGCG